jgi:apolipoprotein N-acyltransferase
LAVPLNYLKVGAFLASWLCVTFCQPYWGAAAAGYALFWWAISDLKSRFWSGTLWFGAVQLVQISWLATDQYMGSLIYGVYAFLCLAMGFQFGWLTTLIRQPLTLPATLGLAGFWVVMEWMRMLPLTGFAWNPAGFALSLGTYSIHLATLFGVYGLSFWVVWINLLALRAFTYPKEAKRWIAWGLCALFPYLFGSLNISFWEPRLKEGKLTSVALVQTALMPEEKDYNHLRAEAHIPPQLQWERILAFLKQSGKAKFDLIVMPEGAVPWDARKPTYPMEVVRATWIRQFGMEALSDFPPLEAPFARSFSNNSWRVSNAFWAQSIANHYGSEVIVGLLDSEGEASYNSAFHFLPKSIEMNRYDKRSLVPVGEYLPFSQWKFFAQLLQEQFGIGDSFEPGSGAKVFRGAMPIGISICSEETSGELVREGRVAGAEVFVNISNDAWFPNTDLPWRHFQHGRIRAVENGVCLMRACNTGVTGAIDCFGRLTDQFPVSDRSAGVLAFEMKIRSFPTLYTFWGDGPILFFSSSFAIGLLFFLSKGKKKLP